MFSRKSQFHLALIGAVAALSTGCAVPPFGYAQDRCLGAYNQCRNSCKDMPFGGAQSSCYDRCLARETQCYGTGDDGAGSSLSQDSLIGAARTDAEKQADYERWKAQKQRERAEAEASEADAEAETIED